MSFQISLLEERIKTTEDLARNPADNRFRSRHCASQGVSHDATKLAEA
jgi:hypothetical protein